MNYIINSSKTTDDLPFKCEALASVFKNILFFCIRTLDLLSFWRIFFIEYSSDEFATSTFMHTN